MLFSKKVLWGLRVFWKFAALSRPRTWSTEQWRASYLLWVDTCVYTSPFRTHPHSHTACTRVWRIKPDTYIHFTFKYMYGSVKGLMCVSICIYNTGKDRERGQHCALSNVLSRGHLGLCTARTSHLGQRSPWSPCTASEREDAAVTTS